MGSFAKAFVTNGAIKMGHSRFKSSPMDLALENLDFYRFSA